MLTSTERIKIYSGVGLFAFLMILTGEPVAQSGTWFFAVAMIALGLWLEMTVTDDQDDDDQ